MDKQIGKGLRYGRLTVIGRTDIKKHNCYMYKCKCDCGNEILVRSDKLRCGDVQSCGCLHDDLFSINVKKAYKANFVDGTHIGRIKSDTIQSNNTSGVKGVRWHKRMSKWQVSIQFKGKNHHLGYFDNLKEATDVRKAAEQELFGKFIKEQEQKKMTEFDWSQLLSMSQVEDIYGRDKSTIKRAIANGKITEGVDCKKFGRDWVFFKPSMDRIYLVECKNLKK